MLDGWRGIAAVTVVLFHIGLPVFGNYAVMLFFVISGYCISAAARNCLRRNLSFQTFMTRRLHRIYPPYLLAVAYFVLTRLIKLAAHGPNDLLHRPPLQWLQNLTLTQWTGLLAHPLPLAADNPRLFVAAFWSLNYEEQFYLLIALAIAWRNRAVWLVLFFLTAASLAWNLRFPNICYGLFVDYWVHFAVGCLVFCRLCLFTRPLYRRIVDLLLTASLAVGILAQWRLGASLGIRSFYFELIVTSAFGLLLILIRPFDDAFRQSLPGRLLIKLGLITYSLYLIHQCNLNFASSATRWLLPAHSPAFISVPLQLACHIALATVFWYFCERPFLNRSLPPQPAPSNAAPLLDAVASHQ